MIVLPAFVMIVTMAACPRHPDFIEPDTGMRLVHVESGQYLMGSPVGEPGHREDETQHRVRLTHPFFIGETEVTQRQWIKVMKVNPSHFHGDLDAPVEQVSWLDAQEFLHRLNAFGTGHYRLPTEAEWEYACRAGSREPYAFGETLAPDQANFDGRDPHSGAGTYLAGTTRVRTYRPNAWGLYDFHGNVWEWCEDRYCAYPAGDQDDPIGDCMSPLQVIRGGSWYFGADSARSALRYTHAAGLRGFSIGFRVVRDEG